MQKTQVEMQEKRRDRRQRVLKGARILFNGRNSTVDCQIRNLSEQGALLRLDHPMIVPEKFLLHIRQNDTIVPTKTVWRRELDIGVEFIGAPGPASGLK